jgi:hypothetical protein
LSLNKSGPVSGLITFVYSAVALVRIGTNIVSTDTFTVDDATDIVVTMPVQGTGIAAGSTVIGIVGTTITVSLAKTDVVSGSIVFTKPFVGPLPGALTPGHVTVLSCVTSGVVFDAELR